MNHKGLSVLRVGPLAGGTQEGGPKPAGRSCGEEEVVPWERALQEGQETGEGGAERVAGV